MSSWKKACEELPESGNVLVMYLEPFFGLLDARVTVAYYDNPKDYENPSDAKGWTQDPSGRPLLHVTHWMEIPTLPDKQEYDFVTQGRMNEDRFNTVNLNKR